MSPVSIRPKTHVFKALACFVILLFALCSVTQLYAQPSISSFSPASGPVGTTVTISGKGFSATPANNIVFFGAVKAVVSAASSTSLTVKVPVGATYQPISVTANGLTGYSSGPFIVTFLSTGSYSQGTFVYAGCTDSLNGLFDIRGLITVDFDGDGKPDEAVVDRVNSLLIISKNTSTGGKVSFAPPITYTTGTYPEALVVGDFNGDGVPDIAVCNEGDNTVSVYKNTSTANKISFAAKVDFATATGPSSVAVADINGDGRPDMAIGTYALDGTVSVLINSGNGGTVSFNAKQDVNAGQAGINNILAADLNNDGKPDIVTSNFTLSTVSILKNTGTVNSVAFAALQTLTTGSSPEGLGLGDLEGDGQSDLVVANSGAIAISVFRNAGIGSSVPFYATRQDYILNNYSTPVDVAIADLNGDGKPDVAVLGEGTISILGNNSKVGQISLWDYIDYGCLSDRRINIADIDGDGKPDLATSGGFLSTQIFTNKINNTYTGNFSPNVAPKGASVIITGANFTGATAVTFGGVPAASFTVNTSRQITAIVGSGASGSVSVTSPSGISQLAGFTFAAPPIIDSFSPAIGIAGNVVTIHGKNFTWATGVNFGGVAAASYNLLSDTVITAKVGSGTTGNVTVLSPYGSGVSTGIFTFIPAPTVSSFEPKSASPGTWITITGKDFINVTSVSFGGVATAGYNVISPDTISALVDTGSSGSVSVTTLSGSNSTTGFTFFSYSAPTITSFSPVSGSIGSTVTINGTNFSTTLLNNIVYFGGVEAVVTSATAKVLTVKVPVGAMHQPISVTSNGLTAYSAMPFSLVYTNKDTTFNQSSFAGNVDFSIGASIYTQPVQLSAADFDGDGKPDIAVTDDGDNLLKIFRNNSTVGNVSFEDPKTFLNIGNNVQDFAIADLDGDGKLDVAVMNKQFNTGNYNEISIFRNTSTKGTISFANCKVYEYFNNPGNGHSISIADFDGDGKPDINFVRNDSLIILKNVGVPGSISFATHSDTSFNYYYGSIIGYSLESNVANFIGFPIGQAVGAVAIKDMNGDGKKDLILVESGDSFVSMYLNTSSNGVVSFGPKMQVARVDTTFAFYFSPFVDDFDGDGKPDLYFLNPKFVDSLLVYKNNSVNGNFSLGLPTSISCSLGILATGDLNGDGLPEITSTNGYYSPILYKELSIFENTSANKKESLTNKINYKFTGYDGVATTSFADIDGDGRVDIIALDYINSTSFSVLRGTKASALPLTLLNFTGKLVKNQTQLNWQTASEINTAYFNVERSTTGTDFATIGKVSAAGNSSVTQSYNFVDAQLPVHGSQPMYIYYRLKMVDADGNFTYSNIVTVNIGGAGNTLFAVYPNPAKDFITVNLPATGNAAQLQITDVAGRVLKTVAVNSNDVQKTINVTGLAKGLYMVVWADGKTEQSINVAIQ